MLWVITTAIPCIIPIKYEYIFYLQLLDGVNNTNYNYTLFTLERNQLMLLKRIIVWRTVGCERGKTSYYINVTVMCSALTLNWYADIYICTVSCSRGSMCKQTFNNALNSLDLRVYRRILIWPLIWRFTITLEFGKTNKVWIY